MAFETPTIKPTSEMLAMLFGDGIEVAQGGAPELPSSVIGTYLADDNSLVGGCVVDAAFAAYAGCAMSGLPVGVAQDAARTGELTEVMTANLAEVMNICSRLLMSDSSDHLRFDTLLKPGEGAQEAEKLAALSNIAFAVSVPRYGSGKLAFFHA